MADVYIAVTAQEILPEEWPPKAASPTITDMQTFFPPTGTQPVDNSQSSVIMSGGEQQPGTPITNTEKLFVTAPNPISNDHHATIHTRPIGVSRPIAIAQPSADVQILGSGQAISNDQNAAVIHHARAITSDAQEDPLNTIVMQPHQDYSPATTPGITNERNVSFAPSAIAPTSITPGLRAPLPNAQPLASSATPMNVSGDKFIAPSAGNVQGGGGYNPDAQILGRPGAVMNVNSDCTIGGGGDTTKMAGSDSVQFGGVGTPVDRGGSDVNKAASGDSTREAGGYDVTMTPNADAMGNQEAYSGAMGEPVANKDLTDVAMGAVGKPLKRNVT